MAEKKKKGRIKRFFNDFKAFISKGNILDMAVGVIIGGAFGKIVTSLVNDIIMPLITLLVGGKSIEDWKFVITPATEEVAESAIRYGYFIQSIIDFLIIAFFIFLALRIIIRLKSRLAKEAAGIYVMTKKETKALLREYRKEGKTRKEALAQVALYEENKRAEAEAAAKAAEEAEKEAEKNKETTESILKDIRTLLANQQNK